MIVCECVFIMVRSMYTLWCVFIMVRSMYTCECVCVHYGEINVNM